MHAEMSALIVRELVVIRLFAGLVELDKMDFSDSSVVKQLTLYKEQTL
jgi:hypothetical protein